MPQHVRVVPPDPAWAEGYRRERALLMPVFGPLLVELHHIGSTAVEGLWAKPILDLMPVVTSLEAVDRLDPELDLVATAQPAVQKMLREQLSWNVAQRLAMDGLQLGRGVLEDLPKLTRLMVHRLKHGVLDLKVDLPGIEKLERSLRLASTRLSLALLISALLIAFGPQIAAAGPVWQGLSAIGWLAGIATLGGLLAFLWSLFKGS